MFPLQSTLPSQNVPLVRHRVPLCPISASSPLLSMLPAHSSCNATASVPSFSTDQRRSVDHIACAIHVHYSSCASANLWSERLSCSGHVSSPFHPLRTIVHLCKHYAPHPCASLHCRLDYIFHTMGLQAADAKGVSISSRQLSSAL